MIFLTTFDNPRLAQAFVDYMATQHIAIDIRINETTYQVELWLPDDSHVDKTKHELAIFLNDPAQPCYQAASWQTGETNPVFHYASPFSLSQLKKQAKPVTLCVLILCVIVYVWMQISGDRQVMHFLAWPDDSKHWYFWRWFTPALLHFSITHILFNLALWWYLASRVEHHLGAAKLIEIVLISALFSNWGQSLFSGTNFGGLSGVVFALIAYIWLISKYHPQHALSIPQGLMAFSLLWLFIGYFDTLGMRIANAAHTSGLIIGILMGLWDNRKQKTPSSDLK